MDCTCTSLKIFNNLGLYKIIFHKISMYRYEAQKVEFLALKDSYKRGKDSFHNWKNTNTFRQICT